MANLIIVMIVVIVAIIETGIPLIMFIMITKHIVISIIVIIIIISEAPEGLHHPRGQEVHDDRRRPHLHTGLPLGNLNTYTMLCYMLYRIRHYIMI